MVQVTITFVAFVAFIDGNPESKYVMPKRETTKDKSFHFNNVTDI